MMHYKIVYIIIMCRFLILLYQVVSRLLSGTEQPMFCSREQYTYYIIITL